MSRHEAHIFDFHAQSFTVATSQYSSENQQVESKVKFSKEKNHHRHHPDTKFPLMI